LFFAPFFGSIFLEKDLKTSRKMFEFVFKMFSEGFAAIPKDGIGQIPIQLKSKLNLTEIKYNERVTHIEKNKVYTNKNECYEAKAILIATEAIGLVRNYKKDINTEYQGTSVLYFSAEQSPIKGKYVALNTSKSKLINNIAVPSNVSSAYAPKGQHLISLSTIGLALDGQDEYINAVKAEMKNWFGAQVNTWKYLKTYHIPYSLARQEFVTYDIDNQSVRIEDNLYMCGDAFSNSSLNAAMKSGRVAAEAINEQLNLKTNS
jgi:protoporphyrinogen oxidase